MIRDIVRTACVLVAMTLAASLVIETRFQIACIDVAQRQAMTHQAPYQQVAPVAAVQPPGRLRVLGRAALDFADAGLGLIR